jgi:hypothetical protein
MAVYNIDISSDTACTNGIEAALTAAGILTTTHYKTTNRLIATTTRSSKVLRIIVGTSRRISVYYGDSWSSGDAVTNQVIVLDLAAGVCAELNVVVSGDIVCFAWRSTDVTPNIAYFCIGTTTTASKNIMMGWYTSTAVTTAHIIRNITDATNIEISTMRRPVISAGGKYYQTDAVVTTATGVILSQGINGFKVLLRDWIRASSLVVYGNDVSASGGCCNGIVGYFPVSFMIAEGNSWTPA